MTHARFLTLPDGSSLPLGYRWFVAHGVTALTPWHFIETQARAGGPAPAALVRGGAAQPVGLA